MNQGGDGTTSKKPDLSVEILKLDFPNNATELNTPNEPISLIHGSPIRPHLSRGLFQTTLE